MKNITTILFLGLSVLFFRLEALAQATLAIGSTTATAGNSVTVSVNATGVTDMQGFQFTITYDHTKLSYVNSSNWSGATNPSGVQVNNLNGQGKITFVYNDVPVNIATGLFFNLNFQAIAGSTGVANISWSDNPTPRELSNSVPAIITATYTDGLVTVNTVTSVNEELVKHGSALYPNPAKDFFRIIGIKSQVKKVEIFNAIGNKLYSKTLNIDRDVVDCKDFPAGVYFVNVRDNEQVFTHKLIIR